MLNRGYKTNRLIHGACRGYKANRAYNCWLNMKARCLRPSHPNYQHYGGRGIRVCERWLDFTAFLADMGEPPEGMTLERKNNNGHYEPGNCVWATRKEQTRNRRGIELLEWDGQSMTLFEWAAYLGISYTTLRRRKASGQVGERLFRRLDGRL